MSLFEDLPFQRGSTFFGSGTPAIGAVGTTDRNLEGTEYVHQDVVLSSGTWVPRTINGNVSHRFVKVRVVRATTAASGTMLPSTLGLWETSTAAGGDTIYQYMKSLTSGVAQFCAPVDEFLSAAGVNQKDLFFVVLRGPALILPDKSSTAIAVGDYISSSGTAGLCVKSDLTSATPATAANQIMTVIGRALLANSNTGTTGLVPVPVDVGGAMIGA